MSAITMKDFRGALLKLKQAREWCIKRKINAWATRQALLTVLALDTEAALSVGVTRQQLDDFDAMADAEVKKFLEQEPP